MVYVLFLHKHGKPCIEIYGNIKFPLSPGRHQRGHVRPEGQLPDHAEGGEHGGGQAEERAQAGGQGHAAAGPRHQAQQSEQDCGGEYFDHTRASQF